MWNLYNQPLCMTIRVGNIYSINPNTHYARSIPASTPSNPGSLIIEKVQPWGFRWCNCADAPMLYIRWEDDNTPIQFYDNPSVIVDCRQCTHREEKYPYE